MQVPVEVCVGGLISQFAMYNYMYMYVYLPLLYTVYLEAD